MKVLAFDSWTPGSKYISDFSKYLEMTGEAPIKLLHIESLLRFSTPFSQSHVFTNEDVTTVNGIECIDFKVYGSSIAKAIETEAPDILLMLSVSHMANRVATVACEKLGIPVVYIMHGELADSQQCVKIREDSRKANQNDQLIKIKKLHKYISLSFQYFLASRSLFGSVYLFKEIIKDSFSFIWTPSPHKSLEIDKALVFSEGDVEKVKGRFLLKNEKCAVVGNLRACDGMYSQLDKAMPSEKLVLSEPYILYLDQSLVDSKFISLEQYETMLKDLITIIKPLGFKLLCKMHPRANINTFRNLNIESVYFEFEARLDSCIKSSSLVLGHYSTALKESLLLDKDIICLNYFNDIRDNNIFDSHPSVTCSSLDDLSDFLKKKINNSEVMFDFNLKSYSFSDKERIMQEVKSQIELLVKENEYK